MAKKRVPKRSLTLRKKKKSKFRKFIQQHRIVLAISIAILLIIFFLFGAKIALYANFLLGNDVILSLDVDKEVLFLEKGQEDIIAFESKVTTNPFCQAACNYKFEDLSTGVIVDEDSFILKSGIGIANEYTVKEQKTGSGIELYRFHIECKGVETVLCHTGEELVTRSKLVIIKYDLTAEEKQLKAELQQGIDQSIEKIAELKSKQKVLDLIVEDLERNKVEPELKQTNQIFKDNLERAFFSIENLQPAWYDQNFRLVKEKFNIIKIAELEEDFIELNKSFYNEAAKYNAFVDELRALRNNLFLTQAAIDEFENALIKIKQQTFLENKEAIIKNTTKAIEDIKISTRDKVNTTCSQLNCNQTQDLCTNILTANTKLQEVNYTVNNITVEKINECISINISSVNLIKITINKSSPIDLNLTFTEPLPDCCVFGDCEKCCIDCEDEDYPVVFLHGHAVNKDLSAEYSLEGFNQIQERLEQDGYLNAGAVTLFTLRDTPEGLWGQVNAPFTIRASYYFDIFEEPENYFVVQAKSENIDTYAIRLNDLIETIKFKTGKNKVKIVAFSMGGLVARKYLQIYGAKDTDRLIMIGTPNHGIVGDIADYCPLIGENLECRDMNAESLFINRLNRKSLPDIPIYNIVGVGCNMNGADGDGAVTEDSATLSGAKNLIIIGTCRSKLLPLHLDLRNLDLYPEVYDTLKKALEE